MEIDHQNSTHKKCFKCEEFKSLDNYYSDAPRSDGLSIYCKSCVKDINNNRYASLRRKERPPESYTRCCADCNKILPTSMFSNAKSSSDGLDKTCRDCKAGRSHKLRTKNKTIMRRYKTIRGCDLCGWRDHHTALHFDHIEPIFKTKKRREKLMYSLTKFRKLQHEYQLLCANCHSIKTYNEGGFSLGGCTNERLERSY